MTILFDVIEDNGYGITKPTDTYEVEDITLDEAKTSLEYYGELYSENNSPKTETSFFFLTNPREL